VVHVNPIIVPVDSSGTPCWSGRQYLAQDVAAWAQQLRQLLADPEQYLQLSAACRQAALAFVGQGPSHLQSFLQALREVGAVG
jgi:hypothetical protein